MIANSMDIDSMRDTLASVTKIHKPFTIYDACGHLHKIEEYGVIEVDALGLVCAEGKMYDICVSCCMDGDPSHGQTETCATTHTHGTKEPICTTEQALRSSWPTTSSPGPKLASTPDETALAARYPQGARLYAPTRAWSVTTVMADHVDFSEAVPVIVTRQGHRYPETHVSEDPEDIYELNIALIRTQLDECATQAQAHISRLAGLHIGLYGNVNALEQSRKDKR